MWWIFWRECDRTACQWKIFKVIWNQWWFFRVNAWVVRISYVVEVLIYGSCYWKERNRICNQGQIFLSLYVCVCVCESVGMRVRSLSPNFPWLSSPSPTAPYQYPPRSEDPLQIQRLFFPYSSLNSLCLQYWCICSIHWHNSCLPGPGTLCPLHQQDEGQHQVQG